MHLHLLFLLLLSALSAVYTIDTIPFPADLEIDIVFPRNDTYALVTPFPIVFAFQNANAFFMFSANFNWELNCKNISLYGGRYFDTFEETPAPSDPFFYVNASHNLANLPLTGDDKDGDFSNFRGNSDTCKLDWTFEYSNNCTREPDGSLLIGGGQFRERTGSVNFTLSPGGMLPSDALNSKTDCSIFGTSVQIASNETTCPHIGDVIPDPKPCNIKSVPSSVLSHIPAPSITFVPTSTSSRSPSSTTTSPNVSPTGNGGGSGGKGTGAAGRNIAGGVITLLLSSIGLLTTFIMVL